LPPPHRSGNAKYFRDREAGRPLFGLFSNRKIHTTVESLSPGVDCIGEIEYV
jgi:hypothetical protein